MCPMNVRLTSTHNHVRLVLVIHFNIYVKYPIGSDSLENSLIKASMTSVTRKGVNKTSQKYAITNHFSLTNLNVRL